MNQGVIQLSKKYGKPGPKSSGRYDRNRNRTEARDKGTEELQRHRARIVGHGDKADPVMAENPLSALLARGLIQEREEKAGCIYAGLRAAHLGGLIRPPIISWAQMVPRQVDADVLPDDSREPRDETPEEKAERIRRSYIRADNQLRSAGAGPRNAVKTVACYCGWPNSPAELGRLRAGLKTLADYWRIPAEKPLEESAAEKAA